MNQPRARPELTTLIEVLVGDLSKAIKKGSVKKADKALGVLGALWSKFSPPYLTSMPNISTESRSSEKAAQSEERVLHQLQKDTAKVKVRGGQSFCLHHCEPPLLTATSPHDGRKWRQRLSKAANWRKPCSKRGRSTPTSCRHRSRHCGCFAAFVAGPND